MAAHNYTAILEGIERVIERPDGTRLRTISLGTGERTVLLAHGYGSSVASWNLIAPRLADEGFRVIAFDQRGHGDSTIGTDGVGTLQMTSDYGAILDEYDAQNVVLVGHSMGGFLAIAFLLGQLTESKDRVGSLLLMGTFAGGVSRKNPQNRLQIPLIKFGVLQKMVGFGPVAKAFTKSLVGDGFEPEMTNAFIPSFLQADHAQLVPILQAMVDEDRYDRLGELDLPCTIIIGTKDKTTPPFHTADLHSGISGSGLLTLDGAGHALNWEVPDAVVAEILGLSDGVATNDAGSATE